MGTSQSLSLSKYLINWSLQVHNIFWLVSAVIKRCSSVTGESRRDISDNRLWVFHRAELGPLFRTIGLIYNYHQCQIRSQEPQTRAGSLPSKLSRGAFIFGDSLAAQKFMLCHESVYMVWVLRLREENLNGKYVVLVDWERMSLMNFA